MTDTSASALGSNDLVARLPGDQAAAIEMVAAALACGLTRPRLAATVAELSDLTTQIRSGAAVEPRLDLALLDALRTLEARPAGPATITHPGGEPLTIPARRPGGS